MAHGHRTLKSKHNNAFLSEPNIRLKRTDAYRYLAPWEDDSRYKQM